MIPSQVKTRKSGLPIGNMWLRLSAPGNVISSWYVRGWERDAAGRRRIQGIGRGQQKRGKRSVAKTGTIGGCSLSAGGSEGLSFGAFGVTRMPRNLSRLPLFWVGRNWFWNGMLRLHISVLRSRRAGGTPALRDVCRGRQTQRWAEASRSAGVSPASFPPLQPPGDSPEGLVGLKLRGIRCDPQLHDMYAPTTANAVPALCAVVARPRPLQVPALHGGLFWTLRTQ